MHQFAVCSSLTSDGAVGPSTLHALERSVAHQKNVRT
jgi:hypothetical protein